MAISKCHTSVYEICHMSILKDMLTVGIGGIDSSVQHIQYVVIRNVNKRSVYCKVGVKPFLRDLNSSINNLAADLKLASFCNSFSEEKVNAFWSEHVLFKLGILQNSQIKIQWKI